MGNNWILGYLNMLSPFLVVLLYMVTCFGIQPVQADDGGALNNTFILSSFTYAKTPLRPYEWRYIRGIALLSLSILVSFFLFSFEFFFGTVGLAGELKI